MHVHVDGQEFDPSVKQIDKMKMTTVDLVSNMSFVLHASSLGVVAIQTKKNESKEIRTNKNSFCIPKQ